jgi:rare lipoprotein A
LLLLLATLLQPTALLAAETYEASGKASYYASSLNGRKTASGELFSNHKLTAAHRYLPFGTQVKVTNQANGKSVVVTINDRGPFTKRFIIDLSQAAFQQIAPLRQGVIRVSINGQHKEMPKVRQHPPKLKPKPKQPAFGPHFDW